MFEFFKRKKPSTLSGRAADFPPLVFKDGSAALEYACKFMECPLHEGSALPAVVLDSRVLLGTQVAVRTQDDGNQLAMIRIASNDGGFVVPATTAGPNGPKLQPGQLIAWIAMEHLPEIAQTANDKRFGWVGLIVGTLKPEHRSGSWVGDERFSP